MIFITGDIHGHPEIIGESSLTKFNSHNFPAGKKLTKNDYVICAGDFGLLWDYKGMTPQEQFWIDWLSNKPWTTLFVDGNHECFPRLAELPSVYMFGGRVGVVTPSIIHLKRGEVYNINGSSIFTFGGALSVDKHLRTVGESWWATEIPSDKEFKNALTNLKKVNNSVDFIITHTAPTDIKNLIMYPSCPDPTEIYLNKFQSMAKFKRWYFGHFHQERQVLTKYICKYYSIEQIA